MRIRVSVALAVVFLALATFCAIWHMRDEWCFTFLTLAMTAAVSGMFTWMFSDTFGDTLR